PSCTETLLQVLHQEPVSPRELNPGVPRDLETVCLKCLQKDTSRRYSSATMLAADLGRFERDEPVLARPIGWVEELLRWCGRNRTVAGLLLTVLASLALGASAATFFAIHASSRAIEAKQAQQNADVERIAAEAARTRAENAERVAKQRAEE